MAQKVVSVSLQARVDGFVSGMRKAKASVDDLTKASDKVTKRDAFEKLSNKAAIAGLGVATAVGVAVKRFADFDQAMSAVAANSGATGKSLDALRDAAVEMGAASQFSAKEAADGINELAKAGVATEDILNGGLKGALDLAAAGQIGVAQAAETTASALNQFGLNGTKAGHVADLLANSANAAQGGVGDMGAALAQAGVAANAAGLNIDETTTTLALFAKAGLIGSDAGTSLKTMMQRLSAPTEKAAAVMDELGIAAYDARGEFIGAEAVMGQLATATADMSTEARMAAFNTIFGADAIRGASIAAEAGAAGYAKMEKEVTKFGGAAKQAEQLTDNLKGDIERLGGALDSVLISTGGGANAALRTLTQSLQGVVESVGKIPGPLLLAGGALASFALLAPKGIMAYREYKATLSALGISLDQIATKSPRAGKALTGATVAAKGFGAALATIAAIDVLFLEDGGIPVEALTQSMLDAKDAAKAFNDAIVKLDTGSEGLGDTLQTALDPSFFESVQHKAGQAISALTLGMADLGEPLGLAEERLAELDQVLTNLATGGHGDRAAQMMDDVADAAEAQGINVDDLKAKLPRYAEALAGIDNAATLAAGGSSAMAEATVDLQGAAEDAQKALDDLKSAIEGLGSPVAAQRAASRNLEASIDAATEGLQKQREELIKSREEEVAGGRASQSAIDAVAKAKQNLAQAQEKLNSLDSKSTAAQKLSAQQRLEKATLALSQAQGKLNDSSGKAKELTDADRLAIEKWADAKMAQTNLLNDATDVGRENAANLDAIRTATLAKVTADFALNESTKGTTAATAIATATMQKGRDAFIAAAIAAGKTKVEAEALADQLGLIPSEVGILVSQSGASEAGAAIDAAARDRNATIWVNKVMSRRTTDLSEDWQGVGGMATGGAVRGPGTGTSDSILTALSNGEHVLTAAEVARMGGQSAVYALRSAIRQGRIPKYATGGAVMSTSRFAPPSMMGGSSSYSTTHDRSLNAENVTIVTPDADSFARGQFRTTPYRAKARPGRG